MEVEGKKQTEQRGLETNVCCVWLPTPPASSSTSGAEINIYLTMTLPTVTDNGPGLISHGMYHITHASSRA